MSFKLIYKQSEESFLEVVLAIMILSSEIIYAVYEHEGMCKGFCK